MKKYMVESRKDYTEIFDNYVGDYIEAESSEEAMELYLEDYLKDLFASAPEPSQLQNIKTKENECIALIELDIDEYLKSFDNRAVKKTLTIPYWLNDLATKKNLNFSQILQDALKERLKTI